jgi:hypothetical protein
MCVSGKWKILEPTKWTSALIRTENLSAQASSVWRSKLDGEINVYHKMADGYLWKAEDQKARYLDLMEMMQRNALKDFVARKPPIIN